MIHTHVQFTHVSMTLYAQTCVQSHVLYVFMVFGRTIGHRHDSSINSASREDRNLSVQPGYRHKVGLIRYKGVKRNWKTNEHEGKPTNV